MTRLESIKQRIEQLNHGFPPDRTRQSDVRWLLSRLEEMQEVLKAYVYLAECDGQCHDCGCDAIEDGAWDHVEECIVLKSEKALRALEAE